MKKRFSNEEILLIILFVLSLAFFFYQHYKVLSWDFSAYVSNAKYFFGSGGYFEPLRPPLVPVIIGLFGFVGWRAAEFIFITITAVLFYFSSVKLAESLKFNRFYFYALSLNVYILLQGLIDGTELLSLVFLEFFLILLVKNKNWSGIFLGLSALSRYTALTFFPLLIFHKNFKKIIINLLLFFLILTPWFIYNYFKFGNFFMSIGDIYANNIALRGYIQQPFEMLHVLAVVNILTPFFLIGLLYLIYRTVLVLKEKKTYRNILNVVYEKRVPILMLIFLGLSLWSYKGIPIKSARYLFFLSLPVIYFSYLGVMLFDKIKKKGWVRISTVIVVGLLILGFLLVFNVPLFNRADIYLESIDKMEELNISDCALMSNAWVMLNYFDRITEDYPRDVLIQKKINEGHYIIFYQFVGEPDYGRDREFLSGFPILYGTSEYVILGEGKCKEIEKVDQTFLFKVNRTLTEMGGNGINQNPCFYLFGNNIFGKFCNIVNFKPANYQLENL